MRCSRCDSEIRSNSSIYLRCGATVQKPPPQRSESSEPQPSSHDDTHRNPGNAENRTSEPTANQTEPQKCSETNTPQTQSTDIGDDVKIFIIAAVFVSIFITGVLSVVYRNNDTPNSSPPVVSTTQPTAETPNQSTSIAFRGGLTESKPPMGTDLLLKIDQIRYCHLEEIRLEAMQSILNESSEKEAIFFNEHIDDYNSRCGSYQYRDG